MEITYNKSIRSTDADKQDRAYAIQKGHDIRKQSGQALIEICVCMVGVVVVLVAMLELTKLCMSHTVAMGEARAEVAEQMQAEVVLFPTADFLHTWDEGADGKRYTADDESVSASSASFYATTVEESVADASDWALLNAVPNMLVELHDSPAMLSTAFGLLRGKGADTAELLPGFQRLVYDAESISIESEVWMTWTKGIY